MKPNSVEALINRLQKYPKDATICFVSGAGDFGYFVDNGDDIEIWASEQAAIDDVNTGAGCRIVIE